MTCKLKALFRRLHWRGLIFWMLTCIASIVALLCCLSNWYLVIAELHEKAPTGLTSFELHQKVFQLKSMFMLIVASVGLAIHGFLMAVFRSHRPSPWKWTFDDYLASTGFILLGVLGALLWLLSDQGLIPVIWSSVTDPLFDAGNRVLDSSGYLAPVALAGLGLTKAFHEKDAVAPQPALAPQPEDK